ncbi:MAG: hypothetical protein KJN64_02630 [Ignavibacteria bacterium]|nr:hypothetical protein [Ignavibacteria bacterium]MBT8390711.1 hypothetical protein [Ignavibacteria bacterium]NNJ53666.1 hypothetical protein [Ignavibacteriaceae bacterium]NNL22514.1 hypothetical protein [Ignavibacteriaceae bacterium]
MIKKNHTEKEKDPPPPILGSWKKLYTLVILNLVALISLFYIFTKAFE